jgi:hypothetical protein
MGRGSTLGRGRLQRLSFIHPDREPGQLFFAHQRGRPGAHR